MVCGCFACDTVCDLFRIQGTLNQHSYHSILQRYSIPSGLRLVGLSFVFQQDTDPKHTSRLCKGYWTKESDGALHQMTWSPQSPDLNPIEMVWDELDRRVNEKQPTSAQHMWELLQGCWKSIPHEAGLENAKNVQSGHQGKGWLLV
uniref:Tc1-like transposase DDE domain-containing protein n=1 Tax=Oncorhynchus tshawytscha TaxID=74940 RepID=A0AAZ3R7L3_ONCTS